MEPNDVIERYNKKEVRKQVDQMDEEEISGLAERVAELASTIEDPPTAIAKRVVAFFEQEKISPEVRILGIRALTANMAGKLVSERLANLLAADIDKVPQDFWEKDNDSTFIMNIDTCTDLGKLITLVERTDLSKRARRAAAMKVAKITTVEEQREKYSRIAEELAPEES